MKFDLLKSIPLFSELQKEDLLQLMDSMVEVTIPAGEFLFREGDTGKKAYIIIEGDMEILQLHDGRDVLLAVRGPGSVIGEMALLEDRTRSASVRGRTDLKLYMLTQKELEALLHVSPSATPALFKSILRRLRENQMQITQSDKMAQLGTLTAGVAHELNNPAAAVKRASEHLTAALEKLDGAYHWISSLEFDVNQMNSLKELVKNAQSAALSPPELDSLVRSDREYEIENWLEDNSISESWLIAPTLVNLKFEEPSLIKLKDDFPSERLNCVLDLLNASYNVSSLTNELNQGAGRISGIVKSLKSYAYLDQAPIQDVDIHEGLDDTLVILHSKLKKNINVKRDYYENLPTIHGHGSELNQVWTNLLHNAIDALEETENPEIEISTRREGVEWVVVCIKDNGPGILAEHKAKIFDSFFTTKPVGKGTGLGLNISYNIVVQKHRGDFKVFSKPGETRFEVWLPLNFEEI